MRHRDLAKRRFGDRGRFARLGPGRGGCREGHGYDDEKEDYRPRPGTQAGSHMSSTGGSTKNAPILRAIGLRSENAGTRSGCSWGAVAGGAVRGAQGILRRNASTVRWPMRGRSCCGVRARVPANTPARSRSGETMPRTQPLAAPPRLTQPPSGRTPDADGSAAPGPSSRRAGPQLEPVRYFSIRQGDPRYRRVRRASRLAAASIPGVSDPPAPGRELRAPGAGGKAPTA